MTVNMRMTKRGTRLLFITDQQGGHWVVCTPDGALRAYVCKADADRAVRAAEQRMRRHEPAR